MTFVRPEQVEPLHGPEKEGAARGVLAETADVDVRVHGNVQPEQRRAVHHRQAAGLAGQPYPPGGILEDPVHVRGRQVPVQQIPALVLERVGVWVQDVHPVLGGGHPQFGLAHPRPDFRDAGDVLGGPGRLGIVQVEAAEGVAVRVESLQADGGSRPQGAAAVLEHFEDQVAGQGVGPVAGEAEGGEVHPVEARESVLGGDPHEPAGVLVDVVHLAVRQPGVGRIEPGHLAGGREKSREECGQGENAPLRHLFQIRQTLWLSVTNLNKNSKIDTIRRRKQSLFCVQFESL